MTHRAETILTTVQAAVTNLTTTGANVFRGRIYPLQESELPCLLVFLGADNFSQMLSQSLIDSWLTIHIDAVVKTASTQLDTTLNKIREEVTIALQASYTQGIAYVMDTREGDTAEPELHGDADQRIGTMRMSWQFLYRRSRTNPGA